MVYIISKVFSLVEHVKMCNDLVSDSSVVNGAVASNTPFL